MSVFNKIYVDTVGNLNGGDISILPTGGEVLLGADPVSDLGVASKQYIDNRVLLTLAPTQVKTSSALPSYVQSGTKVGATLTATANASINSVGIDGVTTLSISDRVLVDSAGTTSDVHNGVYVITDLGSVSTPWILTRATDADTNTELRRNTHVLVEGGLTFQNSGWVVSTTDVDVDVSNVIWSQVSASMQGTMSNVGAGIGEVYRDTTSGTFNLKTLESDSNIVTITNNPDEISFNVVSSNIIETGALNAGSIESGFGNINIPSSTITCSSLRLDDTDSAFAATIQSTSTLTADRTATFDLNDADRTISLNGNITTVGGDITLTGPGSVTIPSTGTLATLNGTETLTNKTLTDASNTVAANNLRSSTGTISIDSNTPANAYILMASSSTTASWVKNTGALGIAPTTDVTTATYTILDTDYMVLCKYSATGAQTITLPSTAAVDVGKTYHIVDCDGNATINNITINATAGLINGSPSIIINTSRQSISVVSDGSNWYVF